MKIRARSRHCLDPDLRLALARKLVDARLRNQRALLRRVNQRRGLDMVTQSALRLSRHLRSLEGAQDVPGLLGVEGAAGQQYWKAWAALLMHGWTMTRRQRRPAEGPVNVALNVTASLLERDTRTVLLARGLHPGFGVLHTPDDGRDALVYDLMEIFRVPMAESVVLELFNTRALRREHFEADGEITRLAPGAYEAIIRGYEERAEGLIRSPRSGHRATWRRIMLEQAEDLAAFFDEGRAFKPYLMDY